LAGLYVRLAQHPQRQAQDRAAAAAIRQQAKLPAAQPL
jgi:hypothetical protein